MQFTTKLFTAILALIALMQFVSGATTYSEMKLDTKITVGVSGVANTVGCTPTVSKLKFFYPKFVVSSKGARVRKMWGEVQDEYT